MNNNMALKSQAKQQIKDGVKKVTDFLQKFPKAPSYVKKAYIGGLLGPEVAQSFLGSGYSANPATAGQAMRGLIGPQTAQPTSQSAIQALAKGGSDLTAKAFQGIGGGGASASAGKLALGAPIAGGAIGAGLATAAASAPALYAINKGMKKTFGTGLGQNVKEGVQKPVQNLKGGVDFLRENLTGLGIKGKKAEQIMGLFQSMLGQNAMASSSPNPGTVPPAPPVTVPEWEGPGDEVGPPAVIGPSPDTYDPRYSEPPIYIPGEIPNNGLDDDGDGRIDAMDPNAGKPRVINPSAPVPLPKPRRKLPPVTAPKKPPIFKGKKLGGSSSGKSSSMQSRTLPNGSIQYGRTVTNAKGQKVFLVGKTVPAAASSSSSKSSSSTKKGGKKKPNVNKQADKFIPDYAKKTDQELIDIVTGDKPDNWSGWGNSTKDTPKQRAAKRVLAGRNAKRIREEEHKKTIEGRKNQKIRNALD